MKGFVLAAGFGSRLKPITDVIPKPLLPIGNVPLISYALKLLAYHNIREITVNTHHLADKIHDALGNGHRYGIRLEYSHETEILGTGGALKQVHPFNETFVVLNSDTLIDLDLSQAILAHKQSGAIATLVLRPMEKKYGAVEIDAEGRVLRLVNNGIEGTAARSLMFTGVHIIEPRLLEYIPPYTNSCIVREVYPKALKNGEHIHSFIFDGFWADAGEPELFYQLNKLALTRQLAFRHSDPWDGVLGHSHLAKNAVLNTPLLIADDVVIEDHAIIGPYTALGRNVHVGKESHLKHCIVLENTKVPKETHWDRCIVAGDKILRF